MPITSIIREIFCMRLAAKQNPLPLIYRMPWAAKSIIFTPSQKCPITVILRKTPSHYSLPRLWVDLISINFKIFLYAIGCKKSITINLSYHGLKNPLSLMEKTPSHLSLPHLLIALTTISLTSTLLNPSYHFSSSKSRTLAISLISNNTLSIL